MSQLTVWAPHAKEVEVAVGGRKYAMTAGSRGWWMAAPELYAPGLDYGFMLDGADELLPDPRSPWQPSGVYGPSRTLDHSRFAWTDDSWQPRPLGAAVIYELHVGTFSPEGTFEAIIPRLDHLLDLGITHVELMPVAEFPGSRGWGYDTVDLFAPHHAYGGPEGLKGLVNACHARGIAVILDVVYNHLGPAGNYLPRFGPYLTDRYATPWGQAVNFDGAGSDEVRRFFCDNALMWLRDYHFDALRLDAVHAIIDTSALHFLEQLGAEVKMLEAQLGRHLALIAESDLNDPRVVSAREVGGYGIDAQWNDDFHHALHAVLTGERDGYYGDFSSMADLAKALKQAFVYDGTYSRFRNRRHGRSARGLSAHNFVGYSQNHDQVGNRADGSRSSHILSLGRQKIATALVLTAPFVPMLFQGEEWGTKSPFQYFTDHEDHELGRAVTKGRREEFAAFGWQPDQVPDPQSPETFERSKLDWDELRGEPHASLLDWYRRLIFLRRTLPALNEGDLGAIQVDFDQSGNWFVLRRGALVVACNCGEETWKLPAAMAQGKILLASEREAQFIDGRLTLPAESVAIVDGWSGEGTRVFAAPELVFDTARSSRAR